MPRAYVGTEQECQRVIDALDAAIVEAEGTHELLTMRLARAERLGLEIVDRRDHGRTVIVTARAPRKTIARPVPIEGGASYAVLGLDRGRAVSHAGTTRRVRGVDVRIPTAAELVDLAPDAGEDLVRLTGSVLPGRG